MRMLPKEEREMLGQITFKLGICYLFVDRCFRGNLLDFSMLQCCPLILQTLLSCDLCFKYLTIIAEEI
jgi:hypothetical protein